MLCLERFDQGDPWGPFQLGFYDSMKAAVRCSAHKHQDQPGACGGDEAGVRSDTSDLGQRSLRADTRQAENPHLSLAFLITKWKFGT